MESQSRNSRGVGAMVSTVVACLLLLFVLLACKRPHEQTPAEKAAEAERQTKETERANKVLQTLAGLETKVKTLGAPGKTVYSNTLQGTRNGYANFDVLRVEDLSDPSNGPIPISLNHYFADCAKHVKEKNVSMSDCTTRYVVVLKPGTYRRAVVSGSSYTTGKVDVTAYVFDMQSGEMIGGGRVFATTPDSITSKESSAEFNLNDKLGVAAFDSLAETLSVKTN